jgi:hypothetical protein
MNEIYEFVNLLDRLNRKERFFLIAEALGKPAFEPDPAFLIKVGKTTGVEVPTPAEVHCFMDYHFDWLYAAVTLATVRRDGPLSSPSVPTATGLRSLNVNANQEDVDLLLVWRVDGGYQLVMVEAKAGTGWSIAQLKSKGNRLRAIFGETGTPALAGVVPHFVLTSPKPVVKVPNWSGVLPRWALRDGAPCWMPLRMPTIGRVTIHRCDRDGMPLKAGDHWKAVGIHDG